MVRRFHALFSTICFWYILVPRKPLARALQIRAEIKGTFSMPLVMRIVIIAPDRLS